MADQKLRVDLLLNSKGFSKGLGRASGGLKAFGSRISSVGKSLALRITAPMVLAGGQAIRMAAQFDRSMTQIKTLVGIAGSEVDAMGQKTKQLASTTGISANEAAEALFFVTSAGLRGSDAMDVLEQSLKASALGLGETKTVADLATSAMNAYGPATLSATDSTDVLVASVREGKLEASELAGAMGSVLPMASNMGVKFHEVGAAFAAMSRTGTNAAVASTQLNSILTGIMKPTEDAKEAMEELNLSHAGLRQQIKDEGLLSVLETLRLASERNSGAFERVFTNVRALRGVLDLTGKSADITAEIFTRMGEASGITAEAYKELAKSPAFQLKVAMNQLGILFTEVGSVLLTALLPAIKSVGNFIKNMVTRFNNLDAATKSFGLAIAGLIAAAPILITIFGSLVTAMGFILSPTGLIIAGLIGIATIIYTQWGGIKKVLVDIANYFIDLYNESFAFRLIVEGTIGVFRAMFRTVKSAFMMAWNIISTFVSNFKAAFVGLGTLVKGVFTFNADDITKGLSDIKNAVFSNFDVIMDEGGKHIKRSMDILAEEGGNAYKKAYLANPISKVTEEDIDNMVAAAGDKITGLKEMLTSLFKTKGGTVTIPKTDSVSTGGSGSDDTDKGGNDLLAKAHKFMESANDIINEGFLNMTMSMAEGLGHALATGGNVAEEMFNIMLSGIAMVMSQLGQLMVTTGVAMKKFQLATSALKSGPMIIAGLLLIAAAGAIKGIMAKKSQGVASFAKGGIVSGPTLAMVGDNTGAGRGNPEVIAPLNKLKGMIDDRANQQINVGGEFRVEGQDLVLALQRAGRERNRIN